MRRRARAQITLVSYRGAAALIDLRGGHVNGVCDAATSVASWIPVGRMRGLTAAARRKARRE